MLLNALALIYEYKMNVSFLCDVDRKYGHSSFFVDYLYQPVGAAATTTSAGNIGGGGRGRGVGGGGRCGSVVMMTERK
jgi:hypothetical protein